MSPHTLRKLWRRLPALLSRSPPHLETTPAVGLTVLVSYLSIVAILCATQTYAWSLAGSLAIAVPFYYVQACFRRVPPRGYATCGEVTQKMVGTYEAMNPVPRTDTAAIFAEVQAILVHEFGVNPSDIVPSARIAQVLGSS